MTFLEWTLKRPLLLTAKSFEIQHLRARGPRTGTEGLMTAAGGPTGLSQALSYRTSF